MGDEIGPELVIHLYDPPTGMKGVLVIDTTALGPTAGGIRMLPDISTIEVARLARAMTYKFAICDFPIGGAKAGIWHDPAAPDRGQIIAAFARALKPVVKEGLYFPGADMGTSDKDVEVIFDVAGVSELAPSGLTLKVKEGMPLEDHLTGFGIVEAAKTASKFANVHIKNATVAIEGFGKVGGGVAKYMERSGAKVVAISTIRGAIYNPRGLNVEKLLEMRKCYGDGVVLEYKDAKTIMKEELFLLPVDVLVPGARPDVINKRNADKIQAKLISEAANIPITPEAEEILFERGIISVPDFIANAGGVIAGIVDRSGGTEEQAFESVREIVSSITKEVVSTALKEKINPRAVALRIAKGKVIEKIKRREEHEPAQARAKLKERLRL
jgi:glutamate dehydrogenase/leucine dehydrogenase